jgi:hypothetical protein
MPSLIVDFTATYKDAAASLTSYLLREDDKGGYAEKGPWKDHGLSEEVDIDSKRVISLDESSDDDDYLGMQLKRLYFATIAVAPP